jgi:CBS domain-containing protein
MIKNIIVISPEKSVVDAANKMKKRGISSLIVTENNEVRGIVTRSDLIDRVVAEGSDPCSTTIEKIMTKEVVTIKPKANIVEALRLMKLQKLSQLPVIEDGKLVGVVALRDALSYLAKFFLISGWRQE